MACRGGSGSLDFGEVDWYGQDSDLTQNSTLDFVMTVHLYGMSIQSIDCKCVFWPFRPMLCNNEKRCASKSTFTLR